MIVAYLGSGALLAGLVMGGFAALLSFWAGSRENPVMVQVGRRAFYASAAMILMAGVLLEVALLTHDFSLAYVTEHTDLSTPVALVAAAFYGGQEGSLLYWALVLGLLGSASLVASSTLGRSWPSRISTPRSTITSATICCGSCSSPVIRCSPPRRASRSRYACSEA